MQVNDYQVTLSDGDYTVLDKMPLLDTTERLEFLTDVHEHYDGTESRYQLRSAPRQMINYKLSVNNDEYPLLMKRLRENLRKPFLIVSHENYLYRTLGTNDTLFIYTNDSIFSELMLVKELDCYQRQFILDGRKAFNAVYLERATAPENLTANVGIYSLYRAMLIHHATVLKNAKHSRLELTFDVLNPLPYSYYNDEIAPIHERLLNDDYLENQYQQHQILHTDGTAQFYHSHWNDSLQYKTLRLILKNLDEYKKIKRWLYSIAGRYRSFLLPDFEHKLQVIANNSGILKVRKCYFNTNVLIVMYHHDFQKTKYTVSSVTTDDDYLYISTSFYGSSVPYSIYPAYWYRFSSDSIEFNFLGKNMFELNLPIQQVKA